MSQIGVFQNNAPVGSGIAFLKGDNVDLVGPDVNDKVKILGGAGIVVTGDAANNKLTIDSTVAASIFHPDDGNDASPFLNTLDILGTANQIETIGIPAGGPYTGIGIKLTDDVDINGELDVGADLIVAGNVTGTNLGINNITATGNINVTNGTLTVTSASPVTFQLNGVMHSTDIIETSAYYNSTYANLGFDSSATAGHNAFQTTDGNFETTNGRITGKYLAVTSCNVAGGVVQTDGSGEFTSSVGGVGKIIIGGGVGPIWANITSPDGSIVVTNGDNSIGLSSGAVIATTYPTDDGTAAPITKILQIRGGANINTAAITGNTVRVNLNNDITLTGFITAAGTIRTTAGNVFATNGDMRSKNGFITATGNITTTSGNITTTSGTISGAHLVATTDLTIPNLVGLPRALLVDAAGLVQLTNSTNGRVVMASNANGVAFGQIVAGTGINIAYTEPLGVRTLTITNTGAGGVKPAFMAYLTNNIAHVTGDGSSYLFGNNTVTKDYDTTNSLNIALPNATFTAPATGNYQFIVSADIHWSGDLFRYYQVKIIMVIAGRTFRFYKSPIQPQFMPGQGEFYQYITNAPLAMGQTVIFSVGVENGTSKVCDLIAHTDTFISGFQIS